MTDGGEARIHGRIDELATAIHEGLREVSTAMATQSAEFVALKQAMARESLTREATCPHLPTLGRLQQKVDRLEGAIKSVRWIAGVVTVALLVPGLNWFGKRLVELLLG